MDKDFSITLRFRMDPSDKFNFIIKYKQERLKALIRKYTWEEKPIVSNEVS